MIKKIVIGLIALLVVIQFFRIDKTNPEVIAENDFINMVQPDENIQAILKTSCYDCHSNETKYPWYTNIAPISWWVKEHINDGRKHLNFSEWGTYKEKRQRHKLEECYEEVEEGEMPMESYLIMHGEAELNAEQKDELVSWFKEQYKGEKKIERSWTDLIDNKKWQTNVETTEGIDRMRALLKENRNIIDVESMNKLGEDLMQEIKTIFAKCTMTGLEHEMLHQYLKVDIHNIQGFIEIKQLNEGDLQTMQGMILNLERNFNTYHNFFETAQND